MTRKIVFVAQRAGAGSSGKEREPLSGAAGRHLAALAGMEHAALLDQFEHVTLLPPNWRGSGEEAARKMLSRGDYLRKGWRGRRVVLLGSATAIAFRLREGMDFDWFKPVQAPPGVEFAVMPYPGGTARWWHDPENREAARQFMQRVKIGLFAYPRPAKKVAGRPERFTPDQIGQALVAADGIMLRAAELLSEETGEYVDRQNVANYCERYPDLMMLRERCRQAIGDIAEQNVLAEIRKGNPDLSLRLLRSKAFIGRGYELAVSQRIDGRLEHEHLHRHAHLHARLGEIGLDLGRYSDEQLDAIEEFAGMIEGPKRNG